MDSRDALAARLLDAQIEFVMAELSGPRLREVIARDVTDIVDVLDKIVVSDAVSRESARTIARTWVAMVGDSPLIELMAVQIADAVYALAEADDHQLGEVITRDHVEALVARILRMRTARDKLLAQMMESPVVATVASWLVNAIVTDFMNANAARAERLPGVGNVFGAGRRAAGAVLGQADRHLGDLLGDAAGKGAHYAMRSLSRAIVETMDRAPLHDAVMEVWDLQAGEPMSNLREYLSQEELRELVAIIHEIWLTLRDTDYFAAAVEAGIDVFFDNYGEHTVGALLDELGVDREQLSADAQLVIPPMIEALRGTGALEALVRARLEPFWTSPETLALLG